MARRGTPTRPRDRRPSELQLPHLREAALSAGTRAHLIAGAPEIRPAWLADARVVGVTAGASTPEDLVAEVVARLTASGARVEEHTVLEERVAFRLPAAVDVRRGHRRGTPSPPRRP
jgi:4-hydroxy-3-methylbut-2-enyl diphosphate reductase